MSRLRPEKLHVRFTGGTTGDGPTVPRRYTLTHSDATGDLFLTVGREYHQEQLASLQTRLMRDEVLAEWQEGPEGLALHVYCHVGGGMVFGSEAMRDAIFRQELPLALEALRWGDRAFFEAHPELDRAPIWVHFQANRPRYRRVERWGTPADYKVT